MPVADTLLRLAEASFYTPRWSADILRETETTLIKFGYAPEQALRRTAAMSKAFPEAQIAGYEDLIAGMKNENKDRHVLACAVRCNAHCIVSDNRKHFGSTALKPYDLECLTADEFLQHQYSLDTDAFIAILSEQADATRRSVADLLELLSRYVPNAASLIRP
jgi:hypothetical protein